MEDIGHKIKKLREELVELENAYYSGNSKVSDDEYDFKLRNLINLEAENPEFQDENSPTKKVGFYRNTEIDVLHEVPMLSLGNAFNKEDLENFFSHCEKEEGDLEYILETKIDGASISIIYENGYLNQAISRGDGEYGEDLTSKILNIPAIPIYLKNIPKRLVLRGEIFIKKSDFESVKEIDGKVFANHRNYVAGCLRLKNPKELQKKKLSLRVYQVLYEEELGFETQSSIIESLKNWGFDSHDEIFVSNKKEEIYEYIEEFGKKKNDLDIPCDGLVLKVNKLRLLEDIGYTSKFPKWAIAYKYPSLIKESKLLDIFPTVGRTGKITYSAQIEPTEIEGSVVQYATLHNANYIMDLDLRIGDYVYVYKSGEIVPKIIGWVKNKRIEGLNKWEPCKNCPFCNSELVIYEKLATQFCINEECSEKNYARVAHWASRAAADIEGLSISIIIKFFNIGILKDIDDLYRVKDNKYVIFNANINIKEKSFNKIVASIEKSKNKEFRYLLFGLGIGFIGEEAAYVISRRFKDIDTLMNVSMEELKEIDGIGEKGAESIINWFKNERNLGLINRLKEHGLFNSQNEQELEVIDGFLKGKKVVITGKLSIPRDEFVRILENKYGAFVYKDISQKIDYLIVGDNAGSKLKKAQEKGIEIIDEKEISKTINFFKN